MANPLAPKSQTGASSFGLFVLRVAVGAALCLHGWPKVQNITNWMGETATIPPYLQAAAAVSEFAGGIALAVGLLTPLAALGIVCTMGYAVYFHINRGDPFVDPKGGASFELALAYFAGAIAVLFCGPGKMSIDGMMFKRD